MIWLYNTTSHTLISSSDYDCIEAGRFVSHYRVRYTAVPSVQQTTNEIITTNNSPDGEWFYGFTPTEALNAAEVAMQMQIVALTYRLLLRSETLDDIAMMKERWL